MGPPWKILRVVSKGDYNYAVVPDHPHATKNGYVLEHRVVMENKLGRILSRRELVHHKRHSEKKNNSEGNLEVKLRGEHERYHGLARGRRWVELKCPGCSKIFERVRSQTHLSKGGKFTACSNPCRGRVSRQLQMHSQEVERKIAENVVRKFRRRQKM